MNCLSCTWTSRQRTSSLSRIPRQRRNFWSGLKASSDDSKISTILTLSLRSKVVSENSLGLLSDSMVRLVKARPLPRLHTTISFSPNEKRSTPYVDSNSNRVILRRLWSLMISPDSLIRSSLTICFVVLMSATVPSRENTTTVETSPSSYVSLRHSFSLITFPPLKKSMPKSLFLLLLVSMVF